jgi:hypothetical protein
LAKQERRRTTAATSGLSVDELIDVISGFAKDGLSIRFGSEVSPGTAVRMSVEDL